MGQRRGTRGARGYRADQFHDWPQRRFRSRLDLRASPRESERTAARSLGYRNFVRLDRETAPSIASRTSPLVAEWPSAARGDLEVRTRKGVIAVRYAGCSLELLPQREVPERYAYNDFEVKLNRG